MRAPGNGSRSNGNTDARAGPRKAGAGIVIDAQVILAFTGEQAVKLPFPAPVEDVYKRQPWWV